MGWWSRIFNGGGGDQRREGYQNPAPNTTTRTATPVSFDSAMSVSAFWACTRLLTEAVAAMPIVCFEISKDAKGRVIRTPTTDYELWQRIAFQPNRRQTRTEFIEQIMLSLTTNGNAYTAIKRNSNGEIVDMVPLVASQMEVQLVQGKLVYQYYLPDGSVKVFAEKSIWHIRLFGNGIVGLSPLGYARNALGIAQASDARVSKLALNGGKATGILTIDRALKEEQRKAIRKNFEGLNYGDTDGLFVLEAGFKYQQTSLSPADTQLIENRRFQVEDIARFMGVPSILINDTAGSTTWGSGIEQIMQGFYKLNLRPYLERIESSLKRHLMPREDWNKIEIEFDFDSLLRSERSTRIESNSTAVNSGQMTPNESRAEEGLPPMPGGDAIYLNGSLVPAGTNLLQARQTTNED